MSLCILQRMLPVTDVDIRAQYTDINGTVLETSSVDLDRITDTNGKTVYSVQGLTATNMSTLNRVYVKAQSRDVVDAYMDHIIVQQVRAGVVVNTFYMDCAHRNAEMEFYALSNNVQVSSNGEQKIYLSQLSTQTLLKRTDYLEYL